MPRNSATDLKIEQLESEIRELKKANEEQGKEIEKLTLRLGMEDELSEMKRGARQGALAWKVMVWAGGVAGASIITALVIWGLSGGTKQQRSRAPIESIAPAMPK